MSRPVVQVPSRALTPEQCVTLVDDIWRNMVEPFEWSSDTPESVAECFHGFGITFPDKALTRDQARDFGISWWEDENGFGL